MPAKYSRYTTIIPIFLVSSDITLNQTKLRLLCSQKSLKYYIGWYSLPDALPSPSHQSMLCTLFIPISSLPYIWQTGTCFSSAYQSPTTSQFRHGKGPEKASSLLGGNYPYSIVSKYSLPRSNPMGVFRRWQCPWMLQSGFTCSVQWRARAGTVETQETF